jgi:adenylate cyclase
MSSERTARFSISLFGRFQLHGPDGPIALTSKKQRALLAYLASTHPAPHSRDKLMTLLWGGGLDAQARQNLRQALCSLRQLLGKGVIVSKEDSISLKPQSISCDVPRFQALVREGGRDPLNEAIDLYKDRLLPDLMLDEDGWSHWLSSDQRRLDEMALDAMVRLGEAELARGDQARAMALAKRAMAIDELREDALRLFMRAAAIDGRKAQALQQYDLLVTLLKDQLDTEPDAATRRLADELRGHLLASDAVRDALTDQLDAQVDGISGHYIGLPREPARVCGAIPREATASLERRSGDPRILPSIAVMPFSVSNSHGRQNIIGHILAHEIIAHLSQAKEFDVISRLSTRALCGRRARLSDIGALLGADYVLWGNCEVKRDSLLVCFELADTGSRTVIWAASRRVPRSAVCEGHPELVAHIVAETSARVLTHELPRARSRPLESLENYSLMLAAINLLHRAQPRNFTHARRLLEVLVERLPHHPLPQAWMAQWHVMKVSQGWSDDIATDGRLALDCARKAGDGDPSCSIAIAMDGWVHTHFLKRLDIASERFALAIEVNPNDSLAWLLKGTMHSFLGQAEEAIQAAERAARLSPLDPRRSYYDCLVASAYCAANQFDRATDLGKRSLRVNRLHSSTLRTLVCSLALSGRIVEARQMAGELMKLEPNLTVRGYLARHPAACFSTGKAWARALGLAGVPA